MRLPTLVRRLAALGLLGAVLALTISEVGSDETPAPTRLEVGTGLPIQLDGVLTPAEWSGAEPQPIGTDGATVRFTQFRGTLLVGVETRGAWTVGDEVILHFGPLKPEKDFGAWSAGAAWIRYEPFKHDRHHLIVYKAHATGLEPALRKVVAASKVGPQSGGFEFALPLSFLGVPPEGTVELRSLVFLARRGQRGAHATWPVGRDMRGQPGQHPPDLRSLARWGVLAGLEKAAQPGAFSKTDWKARLDAQDEMDRRGDEAFALMREMEEERRIFKKQDKRVEAEIFANLRWIAEREPLADVDLLLMAKAYHRVNRYREALALLAALATRPERATAHLARYEQALVLQKLERYEEAAAAWQYLATNTFADAGKRQYVHQVSVAKKLAARHAAAMAERAKDAARTDLPRVEFTTEHGTFVVELLPHDAPKAAAHFRKLVREGYYDGLRWHRVLDGRFAQTGDPGSRKGDCDLAGSGDSDVKVDVEETRRLAPWRGAVCFARKPGLYSNGGQFFINTGPLPDLLDDQKIPYTLFGWVISGMEVVDRLEYCDRVVRARVLEPVSKAPDDEKKQGK